MHPVELEKTAHLRLSLPLLCGGLAAKLLLDASAPEVGARLVAAILLFIEANIVLRRMQLQDVIGFTESGLIREEGARGCVFLEFATDSRSIEFGYCGLKCRQTGDLDC